MGMYDFETPAAPDYAAAAREGAETNAELLPFQMAVDRAARTGQVYTDPKTGQVYDFAGLGDAELARLNSANTRDLMQSGADISRQLTKDQMADLMELLPQYNELNLQQQRRAAEMALEMAPQFTRAQYDVDLAYRPKFGDLTRSEDAKTFRQNLDLGEEGTRRFSSLQNELLPETNRVQLDAQAEAVRRGLETFRATDPNRAALADRLVKAANEDIDAGSTLTAEQLDNMQQGIRRAQAARGNILGAGAAYDEGRMAAEMGQNLQQVRRQSALAILNGSDVAPKFQAASAINPLMPNFQSTQPVTPTTPNFQATTTAAPNLNPVGVGGNTFSYVDPGAADRGANYSKDIWNTEMSAAQNQVNPWLAGLSIGTNAFSALKPFGV